MSRPLFALALSALPFSLGCSSSSPAATDDMDATADGATLPPPDVYVAPPPPCTTSNDEPVNATDFDQSCTVNAQCAAIGAGNACDPCTAGCYNAAINFREVPQYLARFPKAPAGSGATCSCPASFFACCRNGACHADLQCQIDLAEAGATPDTGDAAADDGASDAGVDAGPDAGAAVEGGPADAGGE